MFVILPVYLCNFVDGGEDVVKAISPFVIGFLCAIIINWLRWSKHITAVKNDEAEGYLKKDNIEISYSYDKFKYTD